MLLKVFFFKKNIAYYKIRKIITRYKIIFEKIIKINIKITNKIL